MEIVLCYCVVLCSLCCLVAAGGEVRTSSPSFFEGGNGVEATSSEKVDWHTKFSKEFVKNVEFLQNSPVKICKNLYESKLIGNLLCNEFLPCINDPIHKLNMFVEALLLT